jgi:signal transduction histidine kinase
VNPSATVDPVSRAAESEQASEVIDAFDVATRAVASLQSVDEVLQVIVEQVRPLVGARYAALGIVDEAGGIDRFITSGIDEDTRARIGDLPRGRGLLGLIIRENRPYRIRDIATDDRRFGFPPNHPPMHSFLGVPVTVQGASIGNLYLTEKVGAEEFSAEDQRLVETFALHAGIAIENARLHEQAERLAVVDERERIGQDLHDGIIQSLYAVGLSLEDVPELIRDDPDEVERRVERAIESLHLTIQDIRNFIFGLRPELLSGTSLAAGLVAIVEEFRHNSMIDLELDLGRCRGAGSRHDRPAARPGQRGLEQRRPALRRDPGVCRRRQRWRRRHPPAHPGQRPGLRPGDSRDRLRASRDREHAIARRDGRGDVGHFQRRDRHYYRDPASSRNAARSRTEHAAMTETTPTPTPTAARPLTLLVVDDHEVVREGLVSLLDRRPNFQVVAEAGTVADSLPQRVASSPISS